MRPGDGRGEPREEEHRCSTRSWWPSNGIILPHTSGNRKVNLPACRIGSASPCAAPLPAAHRHDDITGLGRENLSSSLGLGCRSGAGQTELIGLADPTTRPVRRLGQLPVVSVTFSTVAVGSFTAGSATTEASTQPTSRLMRSRWAPVQASRTHDPVTPPQAHRPFSRSRGVHLVMLSRSISSAGSSPLTRGSPADPHHHVHRDRIIPARAGFT